MPIIRDILAFVGGAAIGLFVGMRCMPVTKTRTVVEIDDDVTLLAPYSTPADESDTDDCVDIEEFPIEPDACDFQGQAQQTSIPAQPAPQTHTQPTPQTSIPAQVPPTQPTHTQPAHTQTISLTDYRNEEYARIMQNNAIIMAASKKKAVKKAT